MFSTFLFTCRFGVKEGGLAGRAMCRVDLLAGSGIHGRHRRVIRRRVLSRCAYAPQPHRIYDSASKLRWTSLMNGDLCVDDFPERSRVRVIDRSPPVPLRVFAMALSRRDTSPASATSAAAADGSQRNATGGQSTATGERSLRPP